MRTTVTVDDTLYKLAQKYCPEGADPRFIFNAALHALVHREASKRVLAFGGTLDMIQDPTPPRRSFESDQNDAS